MTYVIMGDDHSGHGLQVGAVVEPIGVPGWYEGEDVDWYTQGIEGDERAIDPRDLAEAVSVTLHIDNFYDGDKVRTVVETTIPAPPEDKESDEYQDWEQDEIYEHTGTGRTEGNSAYFVTVTSSSRPDLIPVGTEYEFC